MAPRKHAESQLGDSLWVALEGLLQFKRLVKKGIVFELHDQISLNTCGHNTSAHICSLRYRQDIPPVPVHAS